MMRAMIISFQIVQMNKLPLIVTFIGTENCNTGHILALENQIDSYLDEIKQTVTEAQQLDIVMSVNDDQ